MTHELWINEGKTQNKSLSKGGLRRYSGGRKCLLCFFFRQRRGSDAERRMKMMQKNLNRIWAKIIMVRWIEWAKLRNLKEA